MVRLRFIGCLLALSAGCGWQNILPSLEGKCPGKSELVEGECLFPCETTSDCAVGSTCVVRYCRAPVKPAGPTCDFGAVDISDGASVYSFDRVGPVRIESASPFTVVFVDGDREAISFPGLPADFLAVGRELFAEAQLSRSSWWPQAQIVLREPSGGAGGDLVAAVWNHRFAFVEAAITELHIHYERAEGCTPIDRGLCGQTHPLALWVASGANQIEAPAGEEVVEHSLRVGNGQSLDWLEPRCVGLGRYVAGYIAVVP